MEIAECLGDATVEIETDFALLSVGNGEERPDSWLFATSNAGMLGMTCGSKHARLSVRIERWSADPGPVLDGWEESDEVPFEPLPGGEPARASGFDSAGERGLDLRGLGRARARVCARGRLDTTDDETSDESWLVQFWPDVENLDAMAGAERKLLVPLRPALDLDMLRSEGGSERHFIGPMWDLVHLIRWAPDQVLRATPREISNRLAITHEHVIGGVVALQESWWGSCDADAYSLQLNDPLELRLGQGPWARYAANRT